MTLLVSFARKTDYKNENYCSTVWPRREPGRSDFHDPIGVFRQKDGL
nr:MAG TPA: hypothetical protein [Caudoviricetes sp.]